MSCPSTSTSCQASLIDDVHACLGQQQRQRHQRHQLHPRLPPWIYGCWLHWDVPASHWRVLPTARLLPDQQHIISIVSEADLNKFSYSLNLTLTPLPSTTTSPSLDCWSTITHQSLNADVCLRVCIRSGMLNNSWRRCRASNDTSAGMWLNMGHSQRPPEDV